MERTLPDPSETRLLEARLGAPAGGLLPGACLSDLLLRILEAGPEGGAAFPEGMEGLMGPLLARTGGQAVPFRPRGEPSAAVGRILDRGCRQLWFLEPPPGGFGPWLEATALRPESPLVVLVQDIASAPCQRLAVDACGHGPVVLARDGAPPHVLADPAFLRRMAALPAPAGPPIPLAVPPATPLKGRLLALDVDGVLVEPGRSFAEAVGRAVRELAPALAWSDERYDAFKRVGGFNNDFRLAAGALALGELDAFHRLEGAVGKGFPDLEARMAELEPACQAAVQRHYAETRWMERSLMDLETLRTLPMDLAIFTGRPPEELEMAFGILGFELPAVSDAAPHLRKPRPEGLLQLADAFRAEEVFFVGDTIDDASALRSARERHPGIRWTFCAVGPDRERIARPGDLQAESLGRLLPMLDNGRYIPQGMSANPGSGA